MNRAPSFQFYPKDWLDFRVQRMSLEAQGAYIKVLCFMWSDNDDQCSIIDNNDLIARAIGTAVEHWLKLREEIQCEYDPILEQRNGHLISIRLRHEAAKQRKYRALQSKKGKQSAQQRVNRGSTTVQPVYQPKGNSSSSSSLSFLKKEKIFSSDSVEVRLSDLLLTLIQDRNPDHKKPKVQTWAKHIDFMMRLDARRPEDIDAVIRWSQQDPFWQNNVLSTEKLRRQFDQLFMKCRPAQNGRHTGNGAVPQQEMVAL